MTVVGVDIFPLPLFPHGSLASSVITTVWIGVFVVAFFNLRFGWVFSGLVVPGYLVPLLMTKPWSAAVVVFEAIATFLIVRFLSEQPARFPYWCSLFGRDRFFALLLFSVVVRLLFDGWLLPFVGERLNTEFGIQIDYRNHLHSFGLIIIALIANQFWKTGVMRGLIPLLVTIGVTYIIIRYGLMELTNFTISKLNSMYEDLAASILASPKAYIILLVTAFLASRMNLKYGWDYNGILVPSLIALQWYQPSKVLTTFGEALIILVLAKLLLKTPAFAQLNMEGARKVLLFFNIGFVLKLLLGYTVPLLWPEVKVTDTFGFGYLLATLMAIRMYDQDVVARLTRVTLQTSLTSLVVATVIGFLLASSFAPQSWSTFSSATPQTTAASASSRLVDVVRADKVNLYQSDASRLSPSPAPWELDRFRSALNEIGAHIARDATMARLEAAQLLHQIGYDLEFVADRYFYLRERAPIRGRGIFVIDSKASNALVVQAPAALDERGSAETATLLFQHLGARGLAIAGARREAQSDGSTDVLRYRNSLFQTFHKTLARNHALQVRSRRALGPATTGESRPSTLWISGGLPPDLDLPRLKRLVGELDIEWARPPYPNVQREASSSAFAELILQRADMRRVAAQTALAERDVALQLSRPRIDGYLQGWLFGAKQRIAERGSASYRPPLVEELIYLDEEILTPLLTVMLGEFVDGEWTAAGVNELRNINIAAHALGYELIRFRHRRTGRAYIILAEQESVQLQRYWGTYVFRLGEASNLVVQIPRPGYELNSFEFGSALFERLDAGALLIAGAHPDTNRDGSADILKLDNTQSVFTLVSQVLHREADVAPLLSVQTRAFAPRDPGTAPPADVLYSVSSGAHQDRQLDVMSRALIETLSADGIDVRLVDGSPQTAGYETGVNPQSLYLAASENKVLGTLWVSPETRYRFREQLDNLTLNAQFDTLSIPTVEREVHRYLSLGARFGSSDRLPTAMKEAVARYVRTWDVVTLARLASEWPEFRVARLIDADSRQTFLAVLGGQDRLYLLANFAPLNPDSRILAGIPPRSTDIDRFLTTRAQKLEFGDTP